MTRNDGLTRCKVVEHQAAVGDNLLYVFKHIGILNHLASEVLAQRGFGYVVLCRAEAAGGYYDVAYFQMRDRWRVLFHRHRRQRLRTSLTFHPSGFMRRAMSPELVSITCPIRSSSPMAMIEMFIIYVGFGLYLYSGVGASS